MSTSVAAGDSVVYVSAAPLTAPQGVLAVIRNRASPNSISAPVIDGGFDPEPVPAVVGDTIEVVITDNSGVTVVRVLTTVTATIPPVVVRTEPPKKKIDVPLNTVISVVFSEPVAAPTLTPTSVELRQGPTVIPGTVRFRDSGDYVVEFVPATPLAPNTDYQLSVSQAVKSITGLALESPVSVDFTTGTEVEGPVAVVAVFPETALVQVGSAAQLRATGSDAQGTLTTGRAVTWASSAPAVAAVSVTVLVTAVAEGQATITAAMEGVSGRATVLVRSSVAPVASVTVTPDSAAVLVGSSVSLSATVKDAAGNPLTFRVVTLASANPAIATVAPAQGVASPSLGFTVTGVAPGVVTITATSEGKTGTARITVRTPPPVVGFIVRPESAMVMLRATVGLYGVSKDSAGGESGIPGTQIAWSSSDPTVATVDNTGLVRGMAVGPATITGRWNGYNSAASITVQRVDGFAVVSSGDYHSCSLTPAGVAYCWGAGDYGQIGSNKAGYVNRAPVAVEGGLTFRSIRAGFDYSCGVTSAGAAYCWGTNEVGQTGTGQAPTGNIYTPALVAGGLNFTAVSAGTYHACGLTTAGAAYCWGYNYYGQLGNGVAGGPELCTTGLGTNPCSTVPIPVAGGLTFTTLSAGAYQTCGLTSGGSAYCWGSNLNGELGIKDTVSYSAIPVAVAGGLTFASISAGGDFTCGVTTAGAAYCWGYNEVGELGSGSAAGPESCSGYPCSRAPVAVAGGLTFAAVNAGSNHACGIKVGGAAYCWGYNYYGQLGNGSVTGPELCSSGYPCSTIPVAVAGQLLFAALDAGGAGTCAVTAAFVGYCWGTNYYGELGDGALSDSSVPVKIAGQP